MEITQYPIGSPGVPWSDADRKAWRAAQSIRRSYEQEVVQRLADVEGAFELVEYGQLDYAEGRYPLLGLVSRRWREDLPGILITGGVHGYETSGVQGAIEFALTEAEHYARDFNFVIAPCVSPWGYETINRWNPEAIDPNRSFYEGSPSAEAAALMSWVGSLNKLILAHFDLHETTDTDNSEFRPALGAREGVEQEVWDIPDGFYLVGDAEAPVPNFQAAVIAAVEEVTHIAPSDAQGRLIGMPVAQRGVINYEVSKLGLCAGITSAPYRTTTEVYPDSPLVDDENCILAQVAAVVGGLEYLITSG